MSRFKAITRLEGFYCHFSPEVLFKVTWGHVRLWCIRKWQYLGIYKWVLSNRAICNNLHSFSDLEMPFQLMKCTTGPVYKIQHISPKKLIQRPVELIFLLPRSNGSDVQSQLWSLSSLVATKWWYLGNGTAVQNKDGENIRKSYTDAVNLRIHRVMRFVSDSWASCLVSHS